MPEYCSCAFQIPELEFDSDEAARVDAIGLQSNLGAIGTVDVGKKDNGMWTHQGVLYCGRRLTTKFDEEGKHYETPEGVCLFERFNALNQIAASSLKVRCREQTQQVKTV